MKDREIQKLEEALIHSWSKQSSTKYTLENRAAGQCGVTALVVQNCLGGNIVKTKVNGAWHYYNNLRGKRYDFTSSQFREPIMYEDIPSSRAEAFSDANEMQYSYLKKAVFVRLAGGGTS